MFFESATKPFVVDHESRKLTWVTKCDGCGYLYTIQEDCDISLPDGTTLTVKKNDRIVVVGYNEDIRAYLLK